jgi:hypothetical protein
MVDVKNKTCEEKGCRIIPYYNNPGQKRGRFCNDHKQQNMINVVNKICENSECNIVANYDICGGKGRFCVKHKEQNMVDVHHKRCEIDECGKRPIYGWLGKKNSHCALHRLKGMILSPSKLCKVIDCSKLGIYELNNVRYCEEHKHDNSKNLGIRKCNSCGLDDILINNICDTCDPNKIKVMQHIKENRVKDILISNNINYTHDKILEETICGRERPDFQIDCGTHFVYIEVDEHQHSNYPCECEQIRMINLVHTRGMPVRFIRYNPDSYKPLIGQKNINIEQREKKLLEYIKYSIASSPIDDGVFSNVIYLFYNDYDASSSWSKLI